VWIEPELWAGPVRTPGGADVAAEAAPSAWLRSAADPTARLAHGTRSLASSGK
jgi:hypothetical protein